MKTDQGTGSVSSTRRNLRLQLSPEIVTLFRPHLGSPPAAHALLKSFRTNAVYATVNDAVRSTTFENKGAVCWVGLRGSHRAIAYREANSAVRLPGTTATSH